jgi:iron complex outermembrane receptor protein
LFIELFGGQLVAKNGSIVSDNTDFGHLAATNLLDMNVSWKNVLGKPLDLTFWATNLTNQHYLTWVEGLLAYGFEVGNVGAPRMYGVKAKVHF